MPVLVVNKLPGAGSIATKVATSEQTAQREEDFAAAGVTDGYAEGDSADGGGGNQTCNSILAQKCARLG